MRLLDGDDRVDLREARDRDRLDVDDDAARDVVRDDGQVGRGRDRLEVPDDRPLRRLVVVRRHDEDARPRRASPPAASDGRSARCRTCRCRRSRSRGRRPRRARRRRGRASPCRSASATRPSCRRRRAPSEPLSTRYVASSRKRSTSTEPSALNGVTIAVRTEPSTVPGFYGEARCPVARSRPGCRHRHGDRDRAAARRGRRLLSRPRERARVVREHRERRMEDRAAARDRLAGRVRRVLPRSKARVHVRGAASSYPASASS